MTSPEADQDGWRQLSPRTLWLEALRVGPRSVQLLPTIVIVGVATSWVYAAPALLALLLLGFGYAWLACRNFRWRITTNAVVIENGILARQHRTIPFDRIQDVSIEQGLVARALEIAKVGFETGASSATTPSNEAGLDSISLADAEALRQTIRSWRDNPNTPAPAHQPEFGPASDTTLFKLSQRDLLLSGIFNFSLVALGIAYAATQWLADLFLIDLSDPKLVLDLVRKNGVDAYVEANQWIVAAIAASALVLIGTATGLVRTTLRHWNFELSLGPRAYRRVRGLTTRSDVAIPISRIQSAILGTGPIRRIWGWHELRVRSLASESDNAFDHQLVPFAKVDVIDRVLQPLGLARPDDGLAWHTPDLRIQALPGTLAGLSLGVIGILVASHDRWEGPPMLILSGLAFVYTAIVAGCQRWAESGSTLYLRRGWWQQRLTILPFASVQSANISHGPLLRSIECVRLELGVPGVTIYGTNTIVAMPPAMAEDLRMRILSRQTRRC